MSAPMRRKRPQNAGPRPKRSNLEEGGITRVIHGPNQGWNPWKIMPPQSLPIKKKKRDFELIILKGLIALLVLLFLFFILLFIRISLRSFFQ